MYSFTNFEPVCCSMSGSNLLLDLHADLSGGRSGGLLFSSLRIFHSCDPHSQRLCLSQICRSRCFSGILLFFLWSNGCWQFDLWLLAFSKSSFFIWKFLGHVLMKSSLKDFQYYFASMGNECNCAVVWTFFGIALLWDWNENWPFPVLWPLLTFPNLLAYWVQYFYSIIF